MHTPAVMIDIETMSVRPNASIVGIGACIFDMYKTNTEGELRENTFDVAITLESNQKLGRAIDAGTVIWWMQQTPEAQQKLYDGEQLSLQAGISALRVWLAGQKPQPKFVWANDPDFDIVILKDAFGQLNEMWPFGFYLNRSVRTVKHLAYPDNNAPEITVGTAHVASDDAIKQALLVQHCIAVLEGRVLPQPGT